jgi:hypothetical protein
VGASRFNAEKVATVDASLQNASAKITGRVLDAKNNEAPFAGVTVSIGPAGSVTTGADGTYVIENLVEDDYTVEFTKADYVTITRVVSRYDFVEGVATLADVKMGGQELLRDKTAADLAAATKWYYNDYRGGKGSNGLDNNWALNYLCTLDYYGDLEEQTEGSALRIRIAEVDQNDNPADPDVFDSYLYGSKLITNDNKYLTISVRTHQATPEAPAYFGVQVVDLSAAEPEAVKIGDTKTHSAEAYAEHTFDLSAYVGKEVIVAIGTYRMATGNYWKQLPIRRIMFTSTDSPSISTGPSSGGTDIVGLEGWKMTQEMVRSTMVNEKRTFTGISTVTGSSTDYFDLYRSWRDLDHVAANWAFVRNPKDPEPHRSEGYIIKTSGSGTSVSTIVPQAYLYGKFNITGNSDQLTIKARNHSVDNTFIKLTAIEENGTVTHIVPSATVGEAAPNDCWKFSHQSGGASSPEAYATFTYDLSSLYGKTVILAFGVYKGEDNSTESKIAFYSFIFD